MATNAPETPDVGAAVAALYPQLRRQSVLALAGIGLMGAVGFTAAMWAWTGIEDGTEGFKIAALALVFGGLAIAFVYRWLRRSQEALVMPVVARAVGLTYSKDARAFLSALPPRLLPKSAVRTAEDFVHGTLGNHMIRMAEVKAETGGKNSRTLFRGLVAQFDNRIAMPAFFLAPEPQTRPGMIFGAWMPTDGLHHLRDIIGPSGVTYGLWTSWSDMEEPPALAAVVQVLTELETQVGGAAALFSATSNGVETHIALSHARNLYQIGGLFPDQGQIFSDVHAATRDLAVPLTIARQLIAAEAAAAGKAAPPS